ncbi:MAG TPA: VCBS repeat-containing protein [Puia sp.]|nr:VCBS repeat-containing protein [Puia sp.]
MNKDGKMDIIVGHVKAPSTVFFNDGSGHNFTPVSFGDSTGVVYGFAFGDFNEDGILDIAAAVSEGINVLYFGNFKSKNRK